MGRRDTLFQRFWLVIDHYEFNYPNRRPLDLHQSPVSPKALLGVRLAAWTYLSLLYVWTLSQTATINTNVIYLTMEGYTLTWLYFGLSLQHYWLGPKTRLSQHLPKFVQIIFEIAFCSEVVITLVFWTLLFRIVLDMPDLSTEVLIVQCNLHSVPLLFLAADMPLNSLAFHLRHLLFLLLFTLLYLAINLAYSLAVHPIYAPLKWRDFSSYLLAFGCVLAVVGVHWAGRVFFQRWKKARLRQSDKDHQLLANPLLPLEEGPPSPASPSSSPFRKTLDL